MFWRVTVPAVKDDSRRLLSFRPGGTILKARRLCPRLHPFLVYRCGRPEWSPSIPGHIAASFAYFISFASYCFAIVSFSVSCICDLHLFEIFSCLLRMASTSFLRGCELDFSPPSGQWFVKQAIFFRNWLLGFQWVIFWWCLDTQSWVHFRPSCRAWPAPGICPLPEEQKNDQQNAWSVQAKIFVEDTIWKQKEVQFVQ